jgi:hypothetical protein
MLISKKTNRYLTKPADSLFCGKSPASGSFGVKVVFFHKTSWPANGWASVFFCKKIPARHRVWLPGYIFYFLKKRSIGLKNNFEFDIYLKFVLPHMGWDC